MRAIKCYLSYTPKLYRWLVLVIFPIALLALGIMMSVKKYDYTGTAWALVYRGSL